MNGDPFKLSHHFNSLGGGLIHYLELAGSSAASVDKAMGTALGTVAYTTDIFLAPIGNMCAAIAQKTFVFVKNNWQPLLAYVFAWGVIITCTGLMYGFQAVALKLTIGMGCGLVFGVITGILTLKIFNKPEEASIWHFLNKTINGIEANGTRPIVLSVAVTVLLAAAVVFPYVIGAAIGVIIGNQITTKIGTGKNLGSDPGKAQKKGQSLQEELADLKEANTKCRAEIAERARTVEANIQRMEEIVARLDNQSEIKK